MDRGRLIAVAAPAELIGRSRAAARVTVRTAPPLAKVVVDALPEVIAARCCDGEWVLETRAPNRVLAELMRRVESVGAELLNIELRGPTLEDVVIELTQGERHEATPGA
jgi:hypothetical protein